MMWFYALFIVSSVLLFQECTSTPIHARPEYLTPIHSNQLENGGAYSFGYDTRGQPGAQLFRQESRNAQGIVSGYYGYVDPNGHLRRVDYTAGPKLGFQPRGDVGVDYETAKAAAQIAKLAPRPPQSVLSPFPPPSVGLSLLYPQGPKVHYPVKSVPYLGIGRPIYYFIHQ